jgi:hypothetical protein
LIALAFAGFAPSIAYAQAYNTSFTTSITYQNVGDGPATINFTFYASPTDTEGIPISRPDLPAGAGTSLFIGSLGDIDEGFQGSAVLASDKEILATLVQLPQNSDTVKNRPLSNGFRNGASSSLIATVLKNVFDTNTLFSVQNADSVANDITIEFFNTSATLVHSVEQTIEAGASYFVDAATVSELGDSFNGSVVVSAWKDGTAKTEDPNGSIVASAMELSVTGTGASAFEGVGAGSTTFYMPSALCEAFGANTSYAIQNTDLGDSTSVTVEYSNGATQTQTVEPGSKKSFIACSATGMTSNFSGAATITSDLPVIAVGKAFGSGLSTAFIGASSGADTIGLPYVRWATDANYANGSQQRTFITVQNIGNSGLSAGEVKVDYIDKNGAVLATDELPAIPAGGKVNTTANAAGLAEFGVYPDGSFGGGAIVYGPDGSELAVVARVSTQLGEGSFASEDYNGQRIETEYNP